MTDLLHKLVGAWKLREWSELRPDGTKTFPLGEDAIGQIVYSEDGHVSAQLARRVTKRFISSDWREATREEASRAFKEYFGYFGTFSIDAAHSAVIHHVEGAWFPNLYKEDQVRHFAFKGDELHLDAETNWGHVIIIWERATYLYRG